MTDTPRENFRTWLRDAHAMEEQAEKLFSGQAERMQDYPDMVEKLNAELNYIRDHQLVLSIRIQQLGSSPSIIKDTSARLFAGAQNILGMAMGDEPVKSILALHTFTQMAIGSYKILVAAALEVKDTESMKICKTLLGHSKARAFWIEDQLAIITRAFLSKRS